LIGEAGDADGVVDGLAADHEEIFVVEGVFLVVAAIAAAGAGTAAFVEEGFEFEMSADGFGAEFVDGVIDEGGFAVDAFGEAIFGIATEDDVIFVVDGDDGGGANFEFGDGGIGAGMFGGVECAEDLIALGGVWDEGFGFFG